MVSSISKAAPPGLTEIRQRLATTRLPDNPVNIVLPDDSSRWSAIMRQAVVRTMKPAGVLVPIMQRGQELTVLLTQRSAALSMHASQVSFPGGRMEESDADIEATALRETHEEVGIAAQHVSVLGYLPTLPTITGFAVTPIVGTVSTQAELAIDPAEVEYAFEVPLSFLLDSSNDIVREREVKGQTLPMVEFCWDDVRIWGATAYMILELRRKLLKQ